MGKKAGAIIENDSSARQSTALSIVLPVYNESGNLEPLLEELRQAAESDNLSDYQPYEIIFVDDRSTDGSRDLLQDIADKHSNVKVIVLSRNFGQSAALAAGIDSASGNVIVTMDSDMQNDPADIPRLLEELEKGYDCVSGWRKDRKDSISKTLPSKIQTYLAWLTGPKIHDFGCTLKAYRSEAIKDIDLHGEGHRYIPARLHHRGYRVSEIPTNHRSRGSGETKYGNKRLVKGSLDLLFHAFWTRFSSRPIHLLGSLSLLFILAGVTLGVHSVYIKYVHNIPLEPKTPRLILISLLILFGVQLFIFGVLAEMITKLYYKSEEPYRISEVIE
ncbi:glycosyltransferase family 2 protein [Natronomonas halophila]|uniref:glycosyltransferase family 2 protein n=1 Tax=Natronomonas halophila TaxID=2747817 RepID=UPI0015B5BBBC|nr:glycosyltransferase family 2 protein [Natronomonas halophila]QLD84793.1 glycosyltransferase family 2 protein [Natronomonas halophila]